MKIESSQVELRAHTSKHFEVEVQSSLEFKQTLLGIAKETHNSQNANIIPLKLSEQNNNTLIIKNHENELNAYEYFSKQIIQLLLERFLGVEDVQLHPTSNESINSAIQSDEKLVVHKEFSFERTIKYTKKDSIELSSKAIIKTQDKQIEVDLNLSYTQEFYEKHSKRISFEEVAFLDPLVINYEGNANALANVDSEMTFMFDLDANGQQETLPLLKSGNGFLALDKNGNGIIDDGMELFGPQSNDGFEELRSYDSDGNHWIDENDAIYEDLRIWTKNIQGEEKLVTLGQSGIGALYVSDVNSAFTHNVSVNESIAHLKSTSIFLKEDGTAGLLSSMDFIA